MTRYRLYDNIYIYPIAVYNKEEFKMKNATLKFEQGLQILAKLRSDEVMKSNARRSLKGLLYKIAEDLSHLEILEPSEYKEEFKQLLPDRWELKK